MSLFFFQAEDGIRDLVRSRGLGDVYKRQAKAVSHIEKGNAVLLLAGNDITDMIDCPVAVLRACLLYTSDAADERSSVDLGGRRIIKNKKLVRGEIGT